MKLRTKVTLFKNYSFNSQLSKLTINKSTDYSLRKAGRNVSNKIKYIALIRINGTAWAKANEHKAVVFAFHLRNTFTPNDGRDINCENVTIKEIKNIMEKTKL